MRYVMLAAATLAALTTACTTRPRRASGPTFAWDTAGSVARAATRPARSPIVGEWIGTLPSADGSGREFLLYLNKDGSARLVTTYFKAGAERVVETGLWSARDRAVTVELTRDGAERGPSFLAYDLGPAGLTPAGAWDTTLWGSAGPPALTRR